MPIQDWKSYGNQIIQTTISLIFNNGERVIQGRVSKFSIASKVEFHSQDLGILHVWKMPYPLQVKQYIYVW